MDALKVGSTVALVALATAGLAQQMDREAQPAGDDVMVLSTWNYDPLYTSGWSVNDVLEQTTLLDDQGEAIGDVENLVFRDDGKLLAVLGEVGGVWAIGATEISIPWPQVTLSDDATEITVPVTEETVDDFPIADEAAGSQPYGTEAAGEIGQVGEEMQTGGQVFKATDLIGQDAYVDGDTRYGEITDIIVNEGAIGALVIASAGMEGRQRAYPYPGYDSWVSPETGKRFRLPWSSEQADVIEDFDYDRLVRGK